MSQTSQSISMHRFPVLLLGAVTLYWAWTMDIWPLGVLMAIMLEAPRWIQRRIQIKDKDIKNIANLTALVFAIFCLNQFITQLHVGIYTITAWLPLIMFPLLLVQLYSNFQEIPLWTLLSRMSNEEDTSGTRVDLRIPYFFIGIIAGSIYGTQQTNYSIVVSIFVLYFMWAMSPGKKYNFVWLPAACFILALSFGIQSSIYHSAGVVQAYTASWFTGKWNKRNTDRNSTAIGQVGKLKLSDNIALRVRSSYDNVVLLQQGLYNRYHGGVWHSSSKNFNFIARNSRTDHYELNSNSPKFGNKLEIFADLTDGEGTLALPLGSYQLHYLGSGDFSRNGFGITKIAGAPEQLQLDVLYNQKDVYNDTPTKEDLEVTPPYNKLMNELVHELGLKNVPPNEATQILKSHFNKHFKYSLIQDDEDTKAKPLHHFLKKNKQGHCEYFATTTALILRAAGIPTRYATGFLMTEYDSDENLFIVRNRHAHAWVLAYIDNQWIELDFTPSTWVEMESGNRSFLQPLYDTFSHWYYKVRKWWNSEDSSLKFILLSTVLLISALWLLKVFKLDKVNLRLSQKSSPPSNTDNISPLSPFSTVEKFLEKNYFRRDESDTLKQWVARISESSALDPLPLFRLIDLHYQYRFSQAESGDVTKEKLQEGVNEWVKKNSQQFDSNISL